MNLNQIKKALKMDFIEVYPANKNKPLPLTISKDKRRNFTYERNEAIE